MLRTRYVRTHICPRKIVRAHKNRGALALQSTLSTLIAPSVAPYLYIYVAKVRAADIFSLVNDFSPSST
jgi:hypothetical protein